MNYEIKKGFVLREVCGEKVIIAEGLGLVNFNKLLSLNDTSAFLWQEAERMGSFSPEQLADALCLEYDVDRETALSDVKEIIDKWQDLGLLNE